MPPLLPDRGAMLGRGRSGVRAVKAGAQAAHAWARREYRRGPRGWAVLFGYATGVLLVLMFTDILLGTPRASQLHTMSHMPEATKVFDVNGQLAFTIFKERRIAVPLSEVSPHLVQAVLAIEDQRFYQHRGVDLWRIGGAMIANASSSQSLQGGSTITQQLARKSFLTDERTLRRKLKEAFLAARIEEHYSKNQILELYLNKVYFGDGYYGIEAASRGYFGKNARSLTVEEAALLAGLIKAPSLYAPTEHLDRARARRAIVLRQMAEAGFVDPVTATTLAASPIKLVNGFEHERTGQYFKNHLMRVLVDQFGWERISQGGLKVYATIDARVQLAAEQAVAKGLDDAEKLHGFKHLKRGDPRAIREGQAPTYLQGALVAIDPTNGEVRAMVGGRNFDESQFNRAVQGKRQAGSAFKPFVYAAAIDAGYTPATLVTGLDIPMAAPGGAWLPDDGHSTATAMTVRTALRTSSNRAAVQVLRAVGIPTAVTFAQRLGLEAPAVPSLVLGSGEVTVVSMAAAYGAFANGGWLRTPVFIRKVEDATGRVLFTSETKPARAISEDTAFIMANMLADVVNAGTGSRARAAGFRFQAGGKTGTTNDYRDAWFIGFTPALVTSVWVGFDQPKTIVPGGYASAIAAPIWGRFMQQAAGAKDSGWVRRPDSIVGVEICRESGGLASEGCRRAVAMDDAGEPTGKPVVGYEYFRRGTEPTDECPIHGNGTGVIDPKSRMIIGPPRTRPASPSAGLVAPIPIAPPSVIRPFPVAASPAAPLLERPAPPAVAPPPPTAPIATVAAPAPKRGLFSKIKQVFSRGEPPKPPPPKPGGRGGG